MASFFDTTRGSDQQNVLERALGAQSEQVILSNDPVAALPEELVLFVELSLVLSDRHVKALLLKVGLLLLPDGGLLQHLRETQTPSCETLTPAGQTWQQKSKVHAD